MTRNSVLPSVHQQAASPVRTSQPSEVGEYRLSLLGRFVLATTPAGPRVSATSAAGSVARLRQAVRWAEPYLGRLSGLQEAADRVNAQPALIVDRRSAVQMMDASIAYVVGPGYAPFASLGRSLALRTISAQALGVWDPIHQQRVLFAPNVLTTADRYSLDHKDFARWAALRTGLWATHFEYAPHLVDYLGDLSRDLPSSAREFAELVVLLSVLPSVELEGLTPRDLPSLGWIRQHRSSSAWIIGLSLLPGVGMSVTEIEELVSHATRFIRQVLKANALPRLLESVISLPTSEELAAPHLWCERVGVTIETAL